MPDLARRWARLSIEVIFGLLNPLLYLAILTQALPMRPAGAEWWLGPLQAGAWILLVAFWGMRLFGSALDLHSPRARAGVRTLLMAALAWLLLYAVKDAWLVSREDWSSTSPLTAVLNILRICPLYLIPAVLLWDYLRWISIPSGLAAGRGHGLLILPNRAARIAVASVAAVALVTSASAVHRRSDTAVRKLLSDHRESILAAAARYDVDPRLIASIVYVTHRDQLSPFRGALERLVIAAWARNIRGELGIGSPDKIEEVGTDENPLLNRALDISVGLAQIKPRTAQTASVLATGRLPDELPEPVIFSYRDIEPVNDQWILPAASRQEVSSPIPVPAERHAVAASLLDAKSNLDTCALILALYQNQWEAANSEWSLRGRPDILATLYQLGFSRSKPHGTPRSNAFGNRVRQVHEQPWLGELLGAPRPPAGSQRTPRAYKN